MFQNVLTIVLVFCILLAGVALAQDAGVGAWRTSDSISGEAIVRPQVISGATVFYPFTSAVNSVPIRVKADSAKVCLNPDSLSTSTGNTVNVRHITTAATAAGSMVPPNYNLDGTDCFELPGNGTQYYMVVTAYVSGTGVVTITGRYP